MPLDLRIDLARLSNSFLVEVFHSPIMLVQQLWRQLPVKPQLFVLIGPSIRGIGSHIKEPNIILINPARERLPPRQPCFPKLHWPHYAVWHCSDPALLSATISDEAMNNQHQHQYSNTTYNERDYIQQQRQPCSMRTNIRATTTTTMVYSMLSWLQLDCTLMMLGKQSYPTEFESS